MSSDLVSALEFIRLNDYASIVIVTAVVYDYLLTLPREIEYVWRRQWSWVSTMFVLVRYVGLFFTILGGINGSTFLPGPVILHRCTVTLLVAQWGFQIFYDVADLVMILRVYAMWNRSNTILFVLLVIYVPQVIAPLVLAGIYDDPKTHLIIATVQVFDVTFCSADDYATPLLLNTYVSIPRFALGATLFVLAVTQTLRQSIEMYKATKRWQPNRYMQLLVRDGIIYFLVNVLFNVTCAFTGEPQISNGAALFLNTLSYITICPIMPRFIIGVRELYYRDLQNRWQGIDTGFGLLSEPVVIENATATATAIEGVAAGRTQTSERETDEQEAIRLEVLGDNTHQV